MADGVISKIWPKSLPVSLDEYLSWNESWGPVITSGHALIPGLGDKADSIKQRIKGMIEGRNLRNICFHEGRLVYDNVAREYTFVTQELATNTFTSIAFHLEPKGKDLYIDWKQFGFQVNKFNVGVEIFWVIVALACVFFVITIPVFLTTPLIISIFKGRRVEKGDFLPGTSAMILMLFGNQSRTRLSKPWWWKKLPIPLFGN